MRLFALQGQTLFAPRFRSAQPWAHAHNPAPCLLYTSQNPAYGQIICRCESVTEGEIIDAIRRTPGARSLDGVKRRTRAGMGRCQAGFCSPRVMEILARELGVPQSEITKSGGASKIIVGTNKDSL